MKKAQIIKNKSDMPGTAQIEKNWIERKLGGIILRK